jgi:hypothetical protein
MKTVDTAHDLFSARSLVPVYSVGFLRRKLVVHCLVTRRLRKLNISAFMIFSNVYLENLNFPFLKDSSMLPVGIEPTPTTRGNRTPTRKWGKTIILDASYKS